MRRYDHRIRRLAKQVQDSQPARKQAQLTRLSDEELTARIIKAALVLGMPEELAQEDLETIMGWGRRYQQKANGNLAEEGENARLKHSGLDGSPST